MISILNIKFPMQLAVKLSKNKCYHHKSSHKLGTMLQNYSLNYFSFNGLLNYLLNKVIQIKSFFYNNLLRQLSFTTNIGNCINSQTNLSFIHHNFISELLLPYYIFLLPKCTTICI